LLADLIDSLAGAPEDRRVAFVVNGDFVDFLAGSEATYFDPQGAPAKLQAIVNDPSFNMIWKAFARFVAKENRTLAVVLGNHDLELALPQVQEVLIPALTGGDAAARHRVVLSMTGAGFAARVAGANVLCVHGNEVDLFNVTDYEHLRRIIRDRAFGHPSQPWVPNAGTKLVIEIMNGIKQNLPFIDLLKPETDAVIPVLVALDQASLPRILDGLDVVRRLARDKGLRTAGFLSEEDEARGSQPRPCAGDGEPRPQDSAAELARILRRAYGIPRGDEQDAILQRILADAEERFAAGQDPLSLVEGGEERLGFVALTGAALRGLWSQLMGRSESEALRAALQHLAHDRTFETGLQTDDFRELDKCIGRDVQIVIAGHTHLERLHQRGSGGVYVNTGTWARLMRLEPPVLADPKRFERFYAAVHKRRLEELDQTEFVIHRPAVASVREQGGVAVPTLQRVTEGGRLSDVAAGVSPEEGS
jgi:UDP-2,3-diacylglucosamine pyrophosphatase LpxH